MGRQQSIVSTKVTSHPSRPAGTYLVVEKRAEMNTEPTLKNLANAVKRMELRLRDLEMLKASGFEVVEEEFDSAVRDTTEALKSRVPQSISTSETQQWEKSLLESPKNRYDKNLLLPPPCLPPLSTISSPEHGKRE